MRISTVFACMGLFVVATPAFADRVLLGSCEGQSLSEENKAVICELIQAEIQRAGHEVVAARVADSNSDDDAATITSSSVKLGSAFIVTLSKSEAGRVVFTSKLKASSLEEMDEIIPRLVRSVLSETELEGDTRVGELSVAEANKGRNRRDARKQMVFAAGFGSASGMDDPGLMYDVSFGYTIDWTSFRLKLDWDIASSTSLFKSLFTSVGVGGRFFLTDREWAPYVGPRLGIGFVKVGNDSWLDTLKSTTSGPLAGFTAGIEAFRNHSATVDLQFKFDTLLKTELGRERIVLYGLQVGVNY